MLIFICTLCMTLVAMLCMHPIAERIGLVDIPNHRKLHTVPIALTGGICVFIAMLVSIFGFHLQLRDFWSLIIGCAILVVIGVLDDFKGVSPYFRLLVQVVLSFLLIHHGNMMIHDLGAILNKTANTHLGPFIAACFTMFVVMLMINAMNMLDGQDGLLAGVAIIQFAWFAFLCHLFVLQLPLSILLIVMGGVFGFWLFNVRWPWRKQAKVFMGDAGSTMLGFITIWFAIYLSQSQSILPHVGPVTFLWIMGLPIFDLTSVVLRRLWQGKSPFRPDRGHVHHLLEDFGLRVTHSTLFLYLVTFLFGLAGVVAALHGCNQRYVLLVFVVLWVAYVSYALYRHNQ